MATRHSPVGDGSTVTVRVDSGMVGELTGAQAQLPNGDWVDMVERTPPD